MEAREAGIPLLLLSRRPAVGGAGGPGLADRRPDPAVRSPTPAPSSTSACPMRTRPRCAAVPRIAAQAVLATRYPLAGAVHVNARFRKPLGAAADRRHASRGGRSSDRRRQGRRAAPDPAAGRARSRTRWRCWSSAVRANPRGVVVAGPLPAFDGAGAAQGRGSGSSKPAATCCWPKPPASCASGWRRRRPVGAFDALLRSRRAALSACGRISPSRSARRRCRRSGWRGSAAPRRRPASCCPASARPTRPAAPPPCCSGRSPALLEAAAARTGGRAARSDAARYAACLAGRRGRGLGGAARRPRGPTTGPCTSTRSHRCCAQRCRRRRADGRQFQPGARPRPRPAARCRRRSTCCTSAAPPASTGWFPAPPAPARVLDGPLALLHRRRRCCCTMPAGSPLRPRWGAAGDRRHPQ